MGLTSPAIRAGRFVLAVLALAVGLAICATGCGQARPQAAHAAFAQRCAENFPARRDPANPLDLPHAPGANPLHGARFFVPGPASGNAASAIASLVGINPDSLPDTESWAHFSAGLHTGAIKAKLDADPALARRVALLSKIASQPQTERISSYSWGGTPLGIFKQTEKVFCRLMRGDRGTVPILTTYFLHSTLGGSPTPARVRAYMPLFRARVNAMAAATGRRPAVFMLELDGLGSTRGVVRAGALPEWEAALRYEIRTVARLPHTVVYVEGGYSDSNPVRYTARVLKAIGIGRIRGFFTNDTHDNWTINEDRWATKVAKRVGDTHFVVNTASNGRGPALNAHPATEGVENLCSPPGRGLGIRDTTHTPGWPLADAYLWEHTPGNSSGCGGGPPAGTFWPRYAERLAADARAQLGPRLAPNPY